MISLLITLILIIACWPTAVHGNSIHSVLRYTDLGSCCHGNWARELEGFLRDGLEWVWQTDSGTREWGNTDG